MGTNTLRINKSSRKKVLFVLPALTAGGAERVLITLMNGLNREKFEPIFLTISDEGDIKNLIDLEIPFNSLGEARLLFCLKKLHKFIKDSDPDIIVSTMAHMNFTLLIMKPFFPRTKFIVREAITPSFFLQKYTKTSFVIKKLYQYLYPKADVVLSPSQIILDEFNDILKIPSDNFYLLSNPVDIKQIEESAYKPRITERRKQTVYFLAAGRLEKQKGYDRLIEHLPHMNHKYNWHLTIIGEGSERSNIESLIEKNQLHNKVALPGLIRPPWEHYMMADCFLMPSLFEGLPNVVLESLACGTPVIATKESGGIQYIKDNSPLNSVSVVDNMHDFLKEMETITPNASETRKVSLLNPLFTPPVVFEKFEKILLET